MSGGRHAASVAARRVAREIGVGVACALLLTAVVPALPACAPGVPAPGPSTPPSGTGVVTLAFAGDVLPHRSLVESAAEPGGRYEFAPVFAPLAPFLSRADLAVANLETCLAGPAPGYQSYPRFNAPDELAAGLVSCGIDVVSTANNHALDTGFGGVVRTLDVLDAAGLGHAGSVRSAAEAALPHVVEVEGVRVALLSYTEATNGRPLPAGRPWAVALLDPPVIAADAARARAAGAELVVALVHWGNEYTRYPSAGQREVAPRLVDAGVDAIVGTGPHMVQPVSVVRGESGRQGLVAWSLGNFVSAQRLRYEDGGLVLFLDVAAEEGRVRLVGARYLPVYVLKGRAAEQREFRVLPVHPALHQSSDLAISAADRRRMTQIYGEVTAHLAGVPGVVPYLPQAGPPD